RMTSPRLNRALSTSLARWALKGTAVPTRASQVASASASTGRVTSCRVNNFVRARIIGSVPVHRLDVPPGVVQHGLNQGFLGELLLEEWVLVRLADLGDREQGQDAHDRAEVECCRLA